MGWLKSQIETRELLDSELTERAYAELASSVSRGRGFFRYKVDSEEQSDGAIRACLGYIGVTPGKVPDGVTDLEERMEFICRPSGTMRRAVSLEGAWYKHAFGAMLGTLVSGEVVALIPNQLHGYSYLEPGTGKKIKVNAKTAPRIAPDATFFYKPLPQTELTKRDLISFMMSVFDRGDYFVVLLAALAATLIGLLPAWANQIAFGTVVPSGQAELILPIGALLVGVMIARVLISACRNLVTARVSMKISLTSEAAAFSRLLSLPASFFKKYESGELATRLAHVPVLAENAISVVLGAGLTAILSIVYIIQIIVYASALALPALVIILAQAVITIVVTRMMADHEKLIVGSHSKVSGTVTSLLTGIQKIKLAGAEDRAFAKWAHGYAKYAGYAYNGPLIIRILPSLVMLIGFIGTIGIYYLAGSSHVSIADYMSFNVAYGQASAAIMQVATLAGQYALIRPALEELEPILETAPEVVDDKPGITSLSGAVELKGVSFRYNEKLPYVLDNLSFSVKPSEYVAIVGKSGCGKSTIMRLMLGFEQPDRGSIFYGPNDIRSIDLRSLRQNIGTVMQDGTLFLGDIRANITISAPTATLDEAWEAAEIAGIADDIRKMPMGMQTFVTEGGGGISGGQRQRLMIARAVCGNRNILLLDEATSALDNVTQKHVSDSLEQLKCTRIVVAHRLSTVRHCDRILVIDKGCVAEEGTYDELIAKDGIFAELVARQRLDNE
ncbi:MAG: ATP-binding cassette domain-containing protein [Coriobacteriales bacterium]|jgi:NHLM bacteriocin system ABC transporter ATP-binding protein